MKFLRTRLFAALVVLLLLGGFSHDVWGRIVEHDHEVAAATDSSGVPAGDDDQDGATHHACCHSHALTVVFNDQHCLYGSVVCEVICVPAEWPPDAVPLGIDVPPQLA